MLVAPMAVIYMYAYASFSTHESWPVVLRTWDVLDQMIRFKSSVQAEYISHSRPDNIIHFVHVFVVHPKSVIVGFPLIVLDGFQEDEAQPIGHRLGHMGPVENSGRSRIHDGSELKWKGKRGRAVSVPGR